MIKDKKKIKREGLVIAVLFVALLASCLFIFRDYVFGDRVLMFNDVGGDTWQQYTMQYADVVNHLKNGTFTDWDFTNGLGINIFNYYMFHPFIWILYLLGFVKGTAHMLLFIVWVMILEILLAGLVFYWFLSQYGFSRSAKFLAAFAYGMSGYLMIWGQHYQFGVVTIYLPLMLIFCEHYIKDRKSGVLFPVAAFFCGLTSVYFSYMILATVGFYMIFRLCAKEGLSLKDGAKKFLGGCAQMILGIGMSLGIFLPTALVLTGVSSRLGKDAGISAIIRNCFTPYGKEYYASLITRLFSSNFQNLQELGDEKFHGYLNYYEDPVVFCSVLAVFLTVQFLILFRKNENKRIKKAVYGSALFMLILVLLPVGGIAYNSFTESTNRYTFVLLPFMLMAAAWTWDRLLAGEKANIPAVAVTEAVLIWVCFNGYSWSLFSEYRANVAVAAVTGTVTAAVLILWNRIPQKKNSGSGWSVMQRTVVYILTAAFIINVVSEGGVTFQDRIYLRKADTPVEQFETATDTYLKQRESKDGETSARAEFNQPQSYFRELYRQDLQDALIWLESYDREFYRVEKDYMSATFAMDSAGQNYRGISTYNSVMNGNLKEFVDTCYPELYCGDQNKLAYWKVADDNWLGAFLGVRYLLSRDKNLDSSKYKLVQQFAGIYLYENVEKASVAGFYSTAISEKSFRALCSEDTRQELLDGAVAVENGADVSSMKEFQNLKKEGGEDHSTVTVSVPEKDSRVEASVHAERDGYVQFMIPYENGWELTVDGKRTEILKSDLGFSSCQVKAGDHKIELTFRAPGLKAGVAGSGVFWCVYIIYLVYFFTKKRPKALIERNV